MKRLAMIMLVLLAPAFTPVFADIAPDEVEGQKDLYYKGDDAEKLYKQLDVKVTPSQTRAGIAEVKVLRPADGQLEIRCTRWPVPNSDDTIAGYDVRCKVSVSTNGKALPKLPPRIRG